MDPNDIQRKITSRTKAIIVVHLYGHPCNMKAIMALAKKHNLYVIEDAAEAFGAKYNNKFIGSFGDIATFSFFGNKTITCGEGGMAVTNNKKLYEKLIHYKGQGLSKNKEYWHDVIGYNYRMTNIAAAIGLAQLEQAKKFLIKKRKIAEWYLNELKHISEIRFLHEDNNVVSSHWMITLILKNQKTRDSLRKYLKSRGIETRPTFWPVHMMPMYYDKTVKLPICEMIAPCGINLPSYPLLKKRDIKIICGHIREFLCKR